jgi:hypothetical protein
MMNRRKEKVITVMIIEKIIVVMKKNMVICLTAIERSMLRNEDIIELP